MPVIKVKFKISKETAEAIAKGDARRFGGIVRDSSGAIIEHLEEVKDAKEVVKEIISPNDSIAEMLKKANLNKNYLIGIGVAITIGAVGVGSKYALKKWKHSQKEQITNDEINETQDMSQHLKEYNDLMRQYYKALFNEQMMTYEMVTRCRTSIEQISHDYDTGTIKLEEIEDIDSQIKVIGNYTKQFREANGFSVSEDIDLSSMEIGDRLEYLIEKFKEQEEVYSLNDDKESDSHKVLISI